MPHAPHPTARPHAAPLSPRLRALLPVPLLLALAACGADTDRSGGAQAPPSLEALPGCDRVATALDGFLSGWTLTPDSGPWDDGAGRSHGVSCVWLSPEARSGNPFEAIQLASLGIMTTVDPRMQPEADIRSIGWVVDDAAVEAIGGHLVYPGGQLDFATPLGPVSPQIVVDKVSVAFAVTGAMVVNALDDDQTMTHRRAVDAAVAVHRLIQR